MTLINRMKSEARSNLNEYLDDSRCFNCTGLAEHFIFEDEPEDEEPYFDDAVTVGTWAEKEFKLNK